MRVITQLTVRLPADFPPDAAVKIYSVAVRGCCCWSTDDVDGHDGFGFGCIVIRTGLYALGSTLSTQRERLRIGER